MQMKKLLFPASSNKCTCKLNNSDLVLCFPGWFGLSTEELFQRYQIPCCILRRLCSALVSTHRFLYQYYTRVSRDTCSIHVYPDPYRHGISYPSGLLAIVVMVTEDNGRVCIVYDDSNTPCGPIRAVFQSDDRAMCYHSNGNLW